MIYLASPYTHPDKAVVLKRVLDVTIAARKLILRRHYVISPIIHSHQVYLVSNSIGSDWSSWADYNRTLLDSCEKLYILPLDGWRESIGVQAEIYHAFKTLKPTFLINPYFNLEPYVHQV